MNQVEEVTQALFVDELSKVECGRGWDSLILPLIAKCMMEGVHIAQIKEKFGTLRFYVDGGSEELHRAIEEAEHKSGTTCEVCGAVGELRGGHWLKTLCSVHNREERNDKTKAS